MNLGNDLEAIREALRVMSAVECDYQEWLNVGMALKNAGGTCEEWETWSAADAMRYHAGECAKKWRGFGRTGTAVVGAGSIVKQARDKGYAVRTRPEDSALEWDAEIGAGAGKIATGYTATLPVMHLSPPQMLAKYVETLFQEDEIVGYVVDVYQPENSNQLAPTFAPKKGNYHETAGALLGRLAECKSLAEAIGDWNEEAGAWIRFNPLDGKGVADSNVKAWRYALVESDKITPEEAYGIYIELQLPIAALVSSAGKSLHAIVRVEANDYREYQKRVDFLYETCKKNGLEIDRNNRNPSRLSRLPGATRRGKVQSLVAVNIGKPSWEEWQAFIAEQNDELPEIENLAEILKNPPQLAPELIKGVLRQGHKALLAGPSKAGKSYLLGELAIAIAEGGQWLKWDCMKGNVLYINFELDAPSFIDRMSKQYKAMGLKKASTERIDIWNLRGHSMGLDELVPRLLRRALKRRAQGHPYNAVIIDPIYKAITGDENAADEMAKFCNNFDKIATALNASVIYCHHHSKGVQAGKSNMDRSSGSGVFARDPDAIIDLLPLDTESLTNKLQDEATIEALKKLMESKGHHMEVETEEDARKEAIRMLGPEPVGHVVAEARKDARSWTGWEISTVLREFRNQEPFRIWFKHPRHIVDEKGELREVQEAGTQQRDLRKEMEERKEATLNAFEVLSMKGKVTLEDMGDYLRGKIVGGRPMSGGPTVTRNWVREAGLKVVKGIVKKPEE